MQFAPSTLIGDVKAAVVADLQLDAASVQLDYNGAQVDDGDSLQTLGFGVGAQHNLSLTLVGPENGPAVNQSEDGGKFADEIEVVVHYDDPEEPPKVLSVQIQRSTGRKKPYLGGYRNRKTGFEYHHASSQTAAVQRDFTGMAERFTRETQTQEQVTRSQQTTRENGNQMARGDLYLSTQNDRTLTPRPYFTADQHADLRLRKTVLMQCYWRGYKARCKAWQLRDAQEQRKHRIAEEERRQQEMAEKQHQKEVERRMNPQSFKDFEILYNELESWRVHETRRIKEDKSLSEKQRLVELAKLLDKETTLLQTIDRLKITANKGNREKRIRRMLDLMSEPKRWQLSDGDVAEVHTPFTTRAKELRELYNGLNLGMLNTDERLDVLLHVKWTVKEFDCNLTREIVDLIDREADLINRGRGEASLVGLRRRLSNMFLQFIETPEFNPEAARFQRIPFDVAVRSAVQPLPGASGSTHK